MYIDLKTILDASEKREKKKKEDPMVLPKQSINQTSHFLKNWNVMQHPQRHRC